MRSPASGCSEQKRPRAVAPTNPAAAERMPVVGGGDVQPLEQPPRHQQQPPPLQQPRLPWLNISMPNSSPDPSGAEGDRDSAGYTGDTNGSSLQPSLQSPPASPQPWLNVCVLVIKEDSGFGMTVTGDNPVYVEHVRPDGAAAKAGVMQGDKIAKVNGIVVINSNHAEVVNLIKASSSVALTLLRKPADVAQRLVDLPITSKSPVRKIITDPIAASAELEQSVAKERITNLQRMVEQAKEDEERAKAEYARSRTQKNSDRWTEAKKTLESVEQQLLAATNQLLSGNHSGNTASQAEGAVGLHTLPSLELPPAGSVTSSSSHSAGSQRRFEFRLARRSNSVASFGSGAPLPPPNSPKVAATAAVQPAEEPGHRVVATRVASQNVFMASSADVPDCSVVVLPPPVVVMPSVDTNLVSAALDSDDETLLRSSADVKVSAYAYGHSPSASMKSPLESGSAPCQSQANIISMEDDEFPGEQNAAVKDHGPFNDLEQLKKRHAHCAIFLSYLVSNCDPSALLFHLVTDSYMQGNLRDMKKWAYEIYSSFIAKDSPLQVKMDDAVIRAIDTVLDKKSDKEDTMRTLFAQARSSSQAEVLIDLADFRSKRDIGLGTFYGESDLYEGMDSAAELRVSEKLLTKLYTQFRENTSPRGECMCYSLVTLMREWGVQKVATASGSSAVSLDRAPSFLMKDRSSIKDLLSGKVSKTKKEVIKNHSFSPQTYHSTTYCDVCNGILWGVGVQGLQCQACEMNIHRDCMQQVDACLKKRRPRNIPPQKKNTPALVPTAPSLVVPSSSQTMISTGDKEELPSGLPSPAKKKEDDAALPSDSTSHGVDRLVERFERGGSASTTSAPSFFHQPESSPDRQPTTRHVRAKSSVELLDVAAAVQTSSATSGIQPPVAGAAVTTAALRPGPATVGRSGSFNDKTSTRSELMQLVKSMRYSRSDVDQDRGAALEAINTDVARRQASSVSSLSDKSDSDVSETAGTHPHTLLTVGGSHHNHRMSILGSPVPPQLATQQPDSDTDVEQEMPSIEFVIPKDQLRKLKPKEKKRQEIINELFYTERSHVRNLKILDKLFHVRMAGEPSISADLVKLVFSNIGDVISIHKSMSSAMRRRQKESAVVDVVADILLERFQGKAGDIMKETCAEFCKNRTYALDTLKTRRRKDAKLQEIIHAAESSPKCRRLQLYDLLIAEVQRLSKYPLLIQNLIKHTHTGDSNSSVGVGANEREELQEALRLSESVVAYVNRAIEECENQQILQSLQRRLDVSPIQKSTHNLIADFRNLDLTKHRLIAEGPLTWRLANRKTISAHAVLLESVLVLLQVYDDGRLTLACQSASTTAAALELSTAHSPVIPLNTILTRHVATDKKAFFIICTAENGPWIYELIASTVEERKRWFKNITDAADSQRKQLGKGIQPTLGRSLVPVGSGGDISRADTNTANPAAEAACGVEGDDSVESVGTSAAVRNDGMGGAAAIGHCGVASEFNNGAGSSSSSLLAAAQACHDRRAEDIETEVDSTDGGQVASTLSTVPVARQLPQPPSEADIAVLLYEKDELILRATEEKKQLIASALKLTSLERQGLHSEVNSEQNRDPRVLVLSAMRELMQVTDIVRLMPAATRSDADPQEKSQQLAVAMASLNKRLEMILDVVVEKDAEVERLRGQLRQANQILSLNADNRAESPVRLSPPRASVQPASTRVNNGSRPSSPCSSSDSTPAGVYRPIADASVTIICSSVPQTPGNISCDSKNESKVEAAPDASRLLPLSNECMTTHDGSRSYSCLSASSHGGYSENGSNEGLSNRGRSSTEPGDGQASAYFGPAAAQDIRGGQRSAGVRFTVDEDAAIASVEPATPSAAAADIGTSTAVGTAVSPNSNLPDSYHSGSWLATNLSRWDRRLPESDAVAALLCSEDDSEV